MAELTIREEITRDKWEWHERFPGHFFAAQDTPGYVVHVCARGQNVLRPVALIEDYGHSALLWAKCSSVEQAQRLCETYYRWMIEK